MMVCTRWQLLVHSAHPLLHALLLGCPLFAASQKQKLQAADESFAKSDTLKALLEKSEANRAKNKKAIANK